MRPWPRTHEPELKIVVRFKLAEHLRLRSKIIIIKKKLNARIGCIPRRGHIGGGGGGGRAKVKVSVSAKMLMRSCSLSTDG